MISNIAVVGGGGVGGYIAAKLSEVASVDLITSSLKSLRVEERGSIKSYHPTILATPPKKKTYDLVIFAVKSYQLEEKAASILPHTHKRTLILPLLNGIEPYEKLNRIFSHAKVLKGAVYIISNRHGDLVRLKGKGAMIVMEHCGKRCQEIAHIFQQTGIKVQLHDNVDEAIWQKYLFIAATAALTTYYSKTFGQIAREHGEEFEELLDEIGHIAKKRGISLDKERAVELLRRSPADAKTSLQLDFERGKETELDNILGYLAKESRAFAKIYEALATHRSRKA
ncbi:MAG: hypothetical protein C6H99_00775 [Epsilonproteobacteria bacterium]|nr:hypothetical protein [Campylobacterota bacterium]NPA64795.1 2-dehydropantoate 2-reductase [Campylobacterota bacterium]